MRVLLVHNFYQQRAGEDAVVSAEVDLLNKGGHETKLFAAYNDNIRSAGSKFSALLMCVYNPRARADLAQEIQSFRPDIVHVHNFFPLLSPSIFDACRDANIPSVMTLHNFRILCPTATLFYAGHSIEKSLTQTSWWTVPKRVYRGSWFGTLALACMVEAHKNLGTWKTKVDRFIVLSNFAKEKFIAGGLPSWKITVKGNWTWSRARRPRRPGAGTGALFVGRLSEEKGLRVLLEAWKRLDYPLTIVGDGPMAEWVAAAAPATVRLLGRLEPEEVRREMESASFLIMPSLWPEMFPMTLVESFASSLPVVCSNIGSMAEIVEEGSTGSRFEAGNADALVQAVRWAVANPEVVKRWGENALALHSTLYAPNTNLAALVSIYREAIREYRVSNIRP